jgi:hypothetical protein
LCVQLELKLQVRQSGVRDPLPHLHLHEFLHVKHSIRCGRLLLL